MRSWCGPWLRAGGPLVPASGSTVIPFAITHHLRDSWSRAVLAFLICSLHFTRAFSLPTAPIAVTVFWYFHRWLYLLFSTQRNLVPQQPLGFPSEEFSISHGKWVIYKLGEWKQLDCAFVETLPHIFHTSPPLIFTSILVAPSKLWGSCGLYCTRCCASTQEEPSFDYLFSLPGLAGLARNEYINN